MTENELSFKIIGIAIELHKNLGPGLLEKIYETHMNFWRKFVCFQQADWPA